MFDLESAIHDWKQRGQGAESVTRAIMDELEAHLREAIAGFVGKGLTEEEAFLVASMRLGEHALLSREYTKVHGTTVWRRRILWMVFGYVGGMALSSAISGFGTSIGALSAYLGYGGMPAGVAGVIAGLISWATVVLLLYFRTLQNDATSVNDSISARWLAVLVIVMVAGAGVGLVARMLHAQIAPMDQFGTSIWWTNIGGLVIKTGIIVAAIVFILTTRVRLSNPSEST